MVFILHFDSIYIYFETKLFYKHTRIDCEELDLLPAKVVNLRAPSFVLNYYETKLGWNGIKTNARVPREIPNLPQEAEIPMDCDDKAPVIDQSMFFQLNHYHFVFNDTFLLIFSLP